MTQLLAAMAAARQVVVANVGTDVVNVDATQLVALVLAAGASLKTTQAKRYSNCPWHIFTA